MSAPRCRSARLFSMFIHSVQSVRARLGSLSRVLPCAAALLLPSCGSGSIPDFSIETGEDVVELQAVTGAKAFVDVTLVPNGYEGAVQSGLESHSVDDLPPGIGVLAICPSSGPETGCDVTVDTTMDTDTPDLQARLGLYVTSDATLVPGAEYPVTVAAAVAGTGAHPVTAQFTLRLIAP